MLTLRWGLYTLGIESGEAGSEFSVPQALTGLFRKACAADQTRVLQWIQEGILQHMQHLQHLQQQQQGLQQRREQQQLAALLHMLLIMTDDISGGKLEEQSGTSMRLLHG